MEPTEKVLELKFYDPAQALCVTPTSDQAAAAIHAYWLSNPSPIDELPLPGVAEPEPVEPESLLVTPEPVEPPAEVTPPLL